MAKPPDSVTSLVAKRPPGRIDISCMHIYIYIYIYDIYIYIYDIYLSRHSRRLKCRYLYTQRHFHFQYSLP